MNNTPAKLYQRWDIHQRAQHWLMMVSFTILAVTGLLIKYAYHPLAGAMATIFGTFEVLFDMHLAAAVLMIISAIYHLIYLVVKAGGRKLRGTMLPNFQDVKDLIGNFFFFIGRAEKGPSFGKYSYKEKVDYLAEYWGTPLMILTGLALWFPGTAARFLPRQVIESAHFAHQGEAILAILVIFTWHLYSVHFSPDFFPMNRVWLTGKISREVMAHEYPRELARLEEEDRLNDR